MRALALVALAACGSDPATDPAADPRCATTAQLIATQPHAIEQPTPDGRDIVDVRGWHGRLYFGFGDLAINTGPIWISSYDPVAGTWVDHLLLETEKIQRFFAIGDQLWAPVADVRGDPTTHVDYAIGDAAHAWKPGELLHAEHVLAVVERAPGDLYLTGEIMVDATQSPPLASSAAWRSQQGGPFQLIFPGPDGARDYDHWFFNAAALGGVVRAGPSWVFDGSAWGFGASLGEMTRATVFAGRIVSATLGELWAFDGTHRTNLGVTLFPSTGIEPTTEQPIYVLSDTEDHLLAVVEGGAVMATTDLDTWTCIGQAPDDVRSIGSLDGTVYLGGAEGRIYAFTSPSW